MKAYGFTDFRDYSHDTSLFHTLENKDLPVKFDAITERTGIVTRQIARSTADIQKMTRKAIERFFEDEGITGDDCNGLVLSSCNPSDPESFQTLADSIAHEYDIHQAKSLNFACSGFPASVEAAMSMSNRREKHILIITAEITSALVNWDDENTAVVFGDGLAATSIIPGGRHSILHSSAVGDLDDPKDCLRLLPQEGTRTIYNEHIEDARPVITMGEHGGKHLYRTVPKQFIEMVRSSEWGLSGVNRIVSHQANGKFTEKMLKELAEEERAEIEVVGTIEDQGNIVSASIPTALSKSIGSFSVGDIVACPAKGAGENFTSGTLSEGLLVFEVGE